MCQSSVHCIFTLINFRCGKLSEASCWLAAKEKSFLKALHLTARFWCSLSKVQTDQLELLLTSHVLPAAEKFYRVTEENNDLPCLSKQKYCWASALRQRGSWEVHNKKSIRLKADWSSRHSETAINNDPWGIMKFKKRINWQYLFDTVETYSLLWYVPSI